LEIVGNSVHRGVMALPYVSEAWAFVWIGGEQCFTAKNARTLGIKESAQFSREE